MKKIAIFASGSGSNFEQITEYFKKNTTAKVAMLVCNKPEAGVVQRANRLHVPVVLISDRTLRNPEILLQTLHSEGINLIVLAGFLKLIPQTLIAAFPDKILNIHPSLLPKFGGKGMYGNKVHEAVLASAEKISGITIHLVTPEYDEGAVVFQQMLPIAPDETVASLAQKIHELEHKHYARVIEKAALRA